MSACVCDRICKEHRDGNVDEVDTKGGRKKKGRHRDQSRKMKETGKTQVLTGKSKRYY